MICRLVDKRFFAYVAHEYLREHPPHSRCLVEYGADFADFLADFEGCEALPYLADIARFERALNIAATVREAPPMRPEALAAVSAEEAAMSRSVCSLRSATLPPLGRSMRSGRQTNRTRYRRSISRAAAPASRSAAPGGVAWRRLDAAAFAFRTALADGLVLAAAMAGATLQDPAFDVTAAVQHLFAEGFVRRLLPLVGTVGPRMIARNSACRERSNRMTKPG